MLLEPILKKKKKIQSKCLYYFIHPALMGVTLFCREKMLFVMLHCVLQHLVTDP